VREKRCPTLYFQFAHHGTSGSKTQKWGAKENLLRGLEHGKALKCENAGKSAGKKPKNAKRERGGGGGTKKKNEKWGGEERRAPLGSPSP